MFLIKKKDIFSTNAILAPMNEVGHINEYMLDQMLGYSQTYLSTNKLCNIEQNYMTKKIVL